jgi:hypothetical protein
MRFFWPVSYLRTTAEAEVYLGYKSGTLAQLRRRQEGPPFIRMGNHIRYASHHLDAYLCGYGGEPAPVNRLYDSGPST